MHVAVVAVAVANVWAAPGTATIPNDPHLVIGVHVASMDVKQYVEAKFQWGRELFKLCPAPLVCNFRCALGFDEP